MKFFVEKAALSYELTRELTQKFDFTVIENYEDFDWGIKDFSDKVSEGKKIIFLLRFKGRFFRKCPGTQIYFCCGYKIFHFAEGCPFDCSYCILQGYFNRPGIKLWANVIEDGFEELKRVLREAKTQGKVLRIGTGEFADSMALEGICNISEKLVHLWKEEDPFAVLELKTKAAISEDYFKKLPSDPRVIFSWSLNPEEIIEKEERFTAPLEARLKSAELAVKYGFSVAFHFDPMIYYSQALTDYPEVLRELLKRFPLDSIAWISFGTLRYPPDLKEVAEKRFPETKIYSYEFVKGLDGKKRYFIHLRNRLYKEMYKVIKDFSGLVYYFCMEGERSWAEAFRKPITSSREVAMLLDASAKRLCTKAGIRYIPS
ncbi:MAG: DNA photolyase [Thermodesulfobacteria bacterium]|nr:DNA photolyase [Thermodesulfobacteriota bacterium]